MFKAPWSLLEPPEEAAPPASLRLELLESDAVGGSSSGGCIGTAQTLHHQSLRPQPDGLFCPDVFGPVPKDSAAVLDYSTRSEPFVPLPRARTFGHIELASPVLHPLMARHERHGLASELEFDLDTLDRILAAQLMVVIDPGDTDALPRQVVDADRPGLDGAVVETGTYALFRLYEEAWGDSAMFMRRLPVLPPDLRPIVPLDEGRFATSDLNDLYRRVIHRNLRVLRLIEHDAAPLLIRIERQLLQEAVDALFLNRGDRPVTDLRGRPLHSLWSLAGLGTTPWDRLMQLYPRLVDPTRVTTEERTGPEHWFLAHLRALGLHLEADNTD